jgi:hypothetical protein
MKKTIFLFLVCFSLFCAIAFAAETVTIHSAVIPLIEGATPAEQSKAANVKVEKFYVDKPLDEVVTFYSSYLKANGFLIIGGDSPTGFDASVKKEESMFTLKIYSEKGKTVIQFAW